MKRDIETHVASTHGPEQTLVFPGMGEVAGQITDMLAGKDKGEGAFDLFRARRTQLALEGFVTAQETVGVIDPVAGLQILIAGGRVGEQRNTDAGFQ